MTASRQSTRIREATPADAALLADLGARSFREAWARFNDPSNMDAYCAAHFTTEHMRGDLACPDVHYLIAEAGGRQVGYLRTVVGAAPQGVAAETPMEISRVYVLSQFHGMGHGSALMRGALESAARSGHDVAWLAVWQRAAQALDFYRRWGFETVGTTTFRLGADVQEDFVMRRPVTSA